jgi:hypothetical protein
LQAFGAKLGCALHYHETGKPLRPEGGIRVKVNTLGQRFDGWKLPDALAAELSQTKTLRQGTKQVSDQFQFASTHYLQMSVYVAALGLDIGMVILVAETSSELAKIQATGRHVHRPGDFLSYPAEVPIRSGTLRLLMPWPTEESI